MDGLYLQPLDFLVRAGSENRPGNKKWEWNEPDGPLINGILRDVWYDQREDGKLILQLEDGLHVILEASGMRGGISGSQRLLNMLPLLGLLVGKEVHVFLSVAFNVRDEYIEDFIVRIGCPDFEVKTIPKMHEDGINGSYDLKVCIGR